MRWVLEYERAWRDEDVDAVRTLFGEDAAYRQSPYEPSRVGHESIMEFWLDDAGRSFTVDARVVAVEGEVAVVRVDVRYEAPRLEEYRDLWILRFAEDGRVAEFEEWAYWPDRGYLAPNGGG